MNTRDTWSKVLRSLCALLFLSLGFAHQPVQASAPMEAYSEQYRLPDGSFADICAESHKDHEPVTLPKCEVCRLASSMDLPAPVGGLAPPRVRVSLGNPLRVATFHLGFMALARPTSRGPPLTI